MNEKSGKRIDVLLMSVWTRLGITLLICFLMLLWLLAEL